MENKARNNKRLHKMGFEMRYSLRCLLRTRLESPNNVYGKVCEYLKDIGMNVIGDKRMVAIIDGETYAISFTSAQSDFAECRQFGDESGLLTMYEKNGKYT